MLHKHLKLFVSLIFFSRFVMGDTLCPVATFHEDSNSDNGYGLWPGNPGSNVGYQGNVAVVNFYWLCNGAPTTGLMSDLISAYQLFSMPLDEALCWSNNNIDYCWFPNYIDQNGSKWWINGGGMDGTGTIPWASKWSTGTGATTNYGSYDGSACFGMIEDFCAVAYGWIQSNPYNSPKPHNITIVTPNKDDIAKAQRDMIKKYPGKKLPAFNAKSEDKPYKKQHIS